jgi:hypothetical protein
MMSNTEDNAIRSLRENELESVSGGLELIHENLHPSTTTRCEIFDGPVTGGDYAGIMVCFRPWL